MSDKDFLKGLMDLFEDPGTRNELTRAISEGANLSSGVYDGLFLKNHGGNLEPDTYEKIVSWNIGSGLQERQKYLGN
jgi:hypothetical protein